MVPGWWFGTFYMFHNIWDVILPIDELIFFRGLGIPPTSTNQVPMSTSESPFFECPAIAAEIPVRVSNTPTWRVTWNSCWHVMVWCRGCGTCWSRGPWQFLFLGVKANWMDVFVIVCRKWVCAKLCIYIYKYLHIYIYMYVCVCN